MSPYIVNLQIRTMLICTGHLVGTSSGLKFPSRRVSRLLK